MSAAAQSDLGRWVSRDDLLLAAGCTSRWLRKQMNSDKWISRPALVKTKNGRLKREVLVASLPPSVQAKLSGSQFALSLPIPSAVSAPVVAELSSDARRRYDLIQPILEYKADPARYERLRLRDGRPVDSQEKLIAYQCQLHGESSRTLKRWLSRFRRGGVAALGDRARQDSGKSRWFEQYPAAKAVVLGAYLEPGRAIMSAYEALEDYCERASISCPSYETVRVYLEAVPAPFRVLAREGERAHNERMSQYLRRDYTSVPANAIWVSDHMIHDAMVRNDCFAGIAQDAPMRLRLTALLDMRTRKVVGTSWTPEGSSRSIVTALRRAILAYGPCRTFYCDNGKDYIKVAKGAQPWGRAAAVAGYAEGLEWIEKQGVLSRLGIEVQHCIKYHPQSKHIERFFRTLHSRFDAHSPHYTSGNAAARPDATHAAMAEHGKLLRAGRGSSSALQPASEFIQMCSTWIEAEYNRAPHSGQGMDGMSPDEVFDRDYPLEARRVPQSLDLAMLLYEQAKRKVDSCAVRLEGRRYIAADKESSAQLYLANERDVLIHYDPCDLQTAIVTDLNRRYLASVVCERLSPHGPEASGQIAASMQERRRLRNATAETVRAIKRQAADLGYQPKWDKMREQAALPEAVAELTTQRRASRKPQMPETTAPPTAVEIADWAWEQMREG